MTYMEQTDDAACNLCKAYALLGQRCIVIRTDGMVMRIIAHEMEMPALSQVLQLAANMVFDGPTRKTMARV